MTEVSLNSVPIDVGCLDVNHSSASPTKALTMSIIDNNVFIFFQGWINRVLGFVLEIYSLHLLSCCRIQTIKVELVWRCCSEMLPFQEEVP